MRAIQVDRRQKKGKHELKHSMLEDAGCTLVPHTLDVGDYAQAPKVSVDTKRDLYELNACLTTDHRRFAEECDRARAQGTMLVVLTENDQGVGCLADLAAWEEPYGAFRVRGMKSKGSVRMRIKGSTMAKACQTMHSDHGVWFSFCAPDEAARRIIEILERGEADGADGAAGGF